ncbi:thioredoxin [Aspergillus avenaceus]|uniref:Thioredoxin n=1 Tax=Aspergillus avenaceus TaxID=36643 RepID=A0A5N6TJF6_ASPAV|nr:thioredoxin [Aspergillus avenaceus]
MAGGVVQINKDNFKEKVLESQEPVVLDFFAEWCGPCKAIAPVLDKLSGEYTNVKFYKIDVDENNALAAEYGVRAMPTFMMFKNGQKVEEIMGANPGAILNGIKKLAA